MQKCKKGRSPFYKILDKILSFVQVSFYVFVYHGKPAILFSNCLSDCSSNAGLQTPEEIILNKAQIHPGYEYLGCLSIVSNIEIFQTSGCEKKILPKRRQEPKINRREALSQYINLPP